MLPSEDMLMSVGGAAARSHTDLSGLESHLRPWCPHVQTHVALKTHGPTATGGGEGLCKCSWPKWPSSPCACQWSVLLSEAMSVSVAHATVQAIQVSGLQCHLRPMCVAFAITWGHSDLLSVLLLRAMSGSVVLMQQRTVFVICAVAKNHVEVHNCSPADSEEQGGHFFRVIDDCRCTVERRTIEGSVPHPYNAHLHPYRMPPTTLPK